MVEVHFVLERNEQTLKKRIFFVTYGTSKKDIISCGCHRNKGEKLAKMPDERNRGVKWKKWSVAGNVLFFNIRVSILGSYAQ